MLFMNLFSLAVLGQLTTSWAKDRLFDPSKLTMFVDELPDMPKIYGFHFISGVPKSKSLKIGMFKKEWVSSFFLFYLFIYFSFCKLVFFSSFPLFLVYTISRKLQFLDKLVTGVPLNLMGFLVHENPCCFNSQVKCSIFTIFYFILF